MHLYEPQLPLKKSEVTKMCRSLCCDGSIAGNFLKLRDDVDHRLDEIDQEGERNATRRRADALIGTPALGPISQGR